MLTVALSISDAELSFCPPCVVQLPAELGLFFSGEERLGSSAMKFDQTRLKFVQSN